jgi:hypothetical protein
MAYYELRSGALGDTGLGDAASTEAMISGLDIELSVVRSEIQTKLNAGQNNTPEFNSLTNRLTDIMQRRDSLAKQLAAEKALQAAATGATSAASAASSGVSVGFGMTASGGAGATVQAPGVANVQVGLPVYTRPQAPAPRSSGISAMTWVGIGVGAAALIGAVAFITRSRGG